MGLCKNSLHFLLNAYLSRILVFSLIFLELKLLPIHMTCFFLNVITLRIFLACTCMIDANPVTTQLAITQTLDLYSNTDLLDPFEYLIIVGSLQYMLLT